VSHAHVRYMNPLPSNLAEFLSKYDQVLIPELNLGQLVRVLRSELGDVPGLAERLVSFTKIQGKPFRIQEVEDRIDEILGSNN